MENATFAADLLIVDLTIRIISGVNGINMTIMTIAVTVCIQVVM
jgi:hypothetical protein